jgi:ElaB/YqjD/DUF883 family membrane-anchored ribosome-binding protein
MANEIKDATRESSFRTDQHKHNDRSPFGEPKKDTGHEYVDKASNVAHDMVDKAHDASNAVAETGENIAHKFEEGHKKVCSFTRENPTAAVLIAVGVGAIIARLLPSSR